MLDSAGRVAVDVACVGCGYNLRMQPDAGVCPECARPIADSIRGYYLPFCNAQWVKRMAGGATLASIALIAGAVAIILFYLVLILIGSAMSAGGGMSPRAPVELVVTSCISLVVGLALFAMLLIGLTRLSTPEPGGDIGGEGLSARRVLRASLYAVLLGVILSVSASFLRGMSRRGGVDVAMGILVLVATLLMIGAALLIPTAGSRHVAWLMRRIPRPGLARFATVQFWAVLASSVLLVIGYSAAVIGMVYAAGAAFGPGGFPATATAPAALASTSPTMPAVPPMAETDDAEGADDDAPADADPATATNTLPMTASFPASAPMPAFAPSRTLAVAVVAAGFGFCAQFLVWISGIVLLALVAGALRSAARDAERNELLVRAAVGAAVPSPLPSPSLPPEPRDRRA